MQKQNNSDKNRREVIHTTLIEGYHKPNVLYIPTRYKNKTCHVFCVLFSQCFIFILVKFIYKIKDTYKVPSKST